MKKCNFGSIKCLECNKIVILKLSRDIGRKKFCSKSCFGKYYYKKGILSFKGKKHKISSRRMISNIKILNKKPDEEFYKIDEITGCWNYSGYKDRLGYGIHCYHGKYIFAYRYFYEKYKGKIPDNLVLDHLCRNTSCVNPEHLEAVTNEENCRRGINSKINMDIADEIRRLNKNNLLSIRELSNKFNLSRTQITRIINNERWKK